jgi:hypothetical protein
MPQYTLIYDSKLSIFTLSVYDIITTIYTHDVCHGIEEVIQHRFIC